MFELPTGKVTSTMPRISRALKQELQTLLIKASRTGNVTLHQRAIPKHDLYRHIDRGFVTGCIYNSSDYDFRTDTKGIQDNSDYQFNVERFASIERD